MSDRTFSLPASLVFEMLDVLRLAHIYALKESHPEELPEDFKPHKWTDEVTWAQESIELYRRVLDECARQP